jgi:type II secretory pathway pseudopilin PulG
MKKEILKGFSLLALIIVLALMTAVASTNAPSMTKSEADATTQSVAQDASVSDARAQVAQH